MSKDRKRIVPNNAAYAVLVATTPAIEIPWMLNANRQEWNRQDRGGRWHVLVCFPQAVADLGKLGGGRLVSVHRSEPS